MDEMFRRYATVQRAVGYFFSALLIFSAFMAVSQSFFVALALAAAGVGTFYATRWLFHRMTEDL